MSFALIADLFKSLGLAGRVFRIGFILTLSGLLALPSEALSFQLAEAIRLRSILYWLTFGFGTVVLVDVIEISRVWVSAQFQARKAAQNDVLLEVSSSIWNVHRDMAAADEYRRLNRGRHVPSVKYAGTKEWAATNALYLAMRQLGLATPDLPSEPRGFATQDHLDYLEAVMPLVRKTRLSDAKDLAKIVCEKIEKNQLAGK